MSIGTTAIELRVFKNKKKKKNMDKMGKTFLGMHLLHFYWDFWYAV